ncbi:MAG: GIY-YIG nuclease family protein [Candidatus Aenigmatarchaeota archaeon]|nr:GIY-YIG nuclease family protein [Candidatus Aenigmarchaeota archaeon]
MKGVYILKIVLKKDCKIIIGSIGAIKLNKGDYAYVGSAQNSLEKRIERHLRKRKKKFWHIDYLLSKRFAKIDDIFYKNAGKNEECKIARDLIKIANPIYRFGSSDCSCKSHLFFINDIEKFNEVLKKYGMKRIDKRYFIS